MKKIDVTDETYDRLVFAARVFGVNIAEVVTRLVHAMETANSAPAPANRARSLDGSEAPRSALAPEQEDVKIHVIYQGRRVSGSFNRSTNQVRVTSDPLHGRTYPSPSAAAVAVVEAINPGRAYPHTNGRTFWIIDDTGENLRSIMGQR